MMRQCLDEGLTSLPEDLPAEGVLADGDPAEALTELANAGGALLMLGSRADGPLRRVLLGTVATKLVRTAACSVVVHPRPARESKPAAAAIGAGSAE